MIETFSNLIKDYFQDKKTIPEFVRENYPLNEEKTRDRAIRRYLSGEVVPQYSAARDLVDKLNIEISEEELMTVLNYSKTERETILDYKHSYLFEKISVRTGDIYKNSDIMEYERQRMFDERVGLVSGGNAKEYIIKLIEYDLQNEIDLDFGNGSQKQEFKDK